MLVYQFQISTTFILTFILNFRLSWYFESFFSPGPFWISALLLNGPPWLNKNYLLTKSNATKWTKLKVKYHNNVKTVLTIGNCKLGLGKKQTWNTHTTKIMSYQVFVRSYSAKGKRPSWLQWGQWLLYQSRKLHSVLSEIVSLVVYMQMAGCD